MISDYDTDQYVSVQTAVCKKEENLEENPCDLIHNGSPAGGAPMGPSKLRHFLKYPLLTADLELVK